MRKLKAKKLSPIGWVVLAVILLFLTIMSYYILGFYFKVKDVRVPDVSNKTTSDAAVLLKESGLKAEIDFESHHMEIPMGLVIDQNPSGGSIVKKNRTVKLNVSLGPEKNKIPDLLGLPLRDAKIEIENSGFILYPEVEFVFNSKVPKGCIF